MTTKLEFRKSSYSARNQNCVEVAHHYLDAASLPSGASTLRDSKHPHHSVLPFTPRAWTAFLSGLKNGEDL